MIQEQYVVTAFLSEGCDPCMAVKEHIVDFGRDNPDVPVYITYSDEVMDFCGIQATPTVGVMDYGKELNHIMEGYEGYSYFKEFMIRSMPEVNLLFSS